MSLVRRNIALNSAVSLQSKTNVTLAHYKFAVSLLFTIKYATPLTNRWKDWFKHPPVTFAHWFSVGYTSSIFKQYRYCFGGTIYGIKQTFILE